MRVLIVQNYYGSKAPSGENVVVEAEKGLLRGGGHEVHCHSRSTDEIMGANVFRLALVAAQMPWSAPAYVRVRRLIRKLRPDVMHVHNTFPLLSPSVFYAARNTNTATVMTVHNYRLFCAAGNHMRGDRVCTACYDRNSVLPALAHGCYQGRLRTIPVAATIALNRGIGTWTSTVDAFIAQTGYQRDKLAGAGLPEERLFVKPHFCATPEDLVPWDLRENKVVHIGRLSKHKGVQVLLQAWSLWGDAAPALELIGDGPERAELAGLVETLRLKHKVTFRGMVSEHEKYAALSRAKLLVMPTLWFETFGLVIGEAFAHGVPVVCSDLSCLPSIVTDGVTGRLCPPGDVTALASTLQRLWADQNALAAMSVHARQEHERKYRSGDNLRMLERIYAAAIAIRRRRLPDCSAVPGILPG